MSDGIVLMVRWCVRRFCSCRRWCVRRFSSCGTVIWQTVYFLWCG